MESVVKNIWSLNRAGLLYVQPVLYGIIAFLGYPHKSYLWAGRSLSPWGNSGRRDTLWDIRTSVDTRIQGGREAGSLTGCSNNLKHTQGVKACYQNIVIKSDLIYTIFVNFILI